MHALIIEPEKTLRQSLRLFMEHQKKFHVSLAHSMKEGLALWQSGQFDLVLCTDALPDGHGLEMLKTIIDQDPKIISILMTGRQDENLRRRALTEGIGAYLEKPFDLNQLEAALGNPMRNAR